MIILDLRDSRYGRLASMIDHHGRSAPRLLRVSIYVFHA